MPSALTQFCVSGPGCRPAPKHRTGAEHAATSVPDRGYWVGCARRRFRFCRRQVGRVGRGHVGWGGVLCRLGQYKWCDVWACENILYMTSLRLQPLSLCVCFSLVSHTRTNIYIHARMHSKSVIVPSLLLIKSIINNATINSTMINTQIRPQPDCQIYLRALHDTMQPPRAHVRLLGRWWRRGLSPWPNAGCDPYHVESLTHTWRDIS